MTTPQSDLDEIKLVIGSAMLVTDNPEKQDGYYVRTQIVDHKKAEQFLAKLQSKLTDAEIPFSEILEKYTRLYYELSRIAEYPTGTPEKIEEFTKIRNAIQQKLSNADNAIKMLENDNVRLGKQVIELSNNADTNEQIVKAIPQLMKRFAEEFYDGIFDDTQRESFEKLLADWIPKNLKSILESKE